MARSHADSFGKWFGGDHITVLNITFCDGSSRPISKDTDESVLVHFVTREGREVTELRDL